MPNGRSETNEDNGESFKAKVGPQEVVGDPALGTKDETQQRNLRTEFLTEVNESLLELPETMRHRIVHRCSDVWGFLEENWETPENIEEGAAQSRLTNLKTAHESGKDLSYRTWTRMVFEKIPVGDITPKELASIKKGAGRAGQKTVVNGISDKLADFWRENLEFRDSEDVEEIVVETHEIPSEDGEPEISLKGPELEKPKKPESDPPPDSTPETPPASKLEEAEHEEIVVWTKDGVPAFSFEKPIDPARDEKNLELIEKTAKKLGIKVVPLKFIDSGHQGSVYLLEHIAGSESETYPYLVAKVFKSGHLEDIKVNPPINLGLLNMYEGEDERFGNSLGEIYTARRLGQTDHALLMECIVGKLSFELQDLNQSKLQEVMQLVPLQVAHYLYITRRRGLINMDPKSASSILVQEDGKMRMIDTDSTVEIAGLEKDPRNDIITISKWESNAFLSTVIHSLEVMDAESAAVMKQVFYKLDKKEYAGLSREEKFKLGEVVGSEEFLRIPFEIRTLLLYELGLFKDAEKNSDRSEGAYLKRLEMQLAISAKLGYNSSSISKCLQEELSNVNPEEVFREFREAALTDFPLEAGLTADELQEIAREKPHLFAKEILQASFFRHVLMPRIRFGALVSAEDLYESGSKTYAEFQRKFKKAAGVYQKEVEPIESKIRMYETKGSKNLSKTQLEELLDLRESFAQHLALEYPVDTLLISEVSGVDIDSLANTPEEYYKALVKRETVNNVLGLRKVLKQQTEDGEFISSEGQGVLDKVRALYNTSYKEVDSEEKLQKFSENMKQLISEVIEEYK